MRDCSRSPDILGYVEMKLPISSQERELVTIVGPETILAVPR